MVIKHKELKGKLNKECIVILTDGFRFKDKLIGYSIEDEKFLLLLESYGRIDSGIISKIEFLKDTDTI